MKAKFIKKVSLSLDIFSFYFEPETKLDFIAGQFIELSLNLTDPDDRGNKRWFTISSAPDENPISVTTRLASERSSTFKTKLKSLKKNESVDISMPMGDFVLPKSRSLDLVFIAIGIGITPFTSMLSKKGNESRNIELIHASKKDSDFVFKNLLSSSTIKYIEYSAHLNVKTINVLISSLGSKTIYLSGPEKSVETLTKDLIKSGIKPNKIRTDYFSGYTEI